MQDARSKAKKFDPQRKNQAASSMQSNQITVKSAKLSLKSNDQLVKQSFNDASLSISSISIKSFVKKKTKTLENSRFSSFYSQMRFSFQEDEENSAIFENEIFRKKLNFNASSDKMRIVRKAAVQHFIRFEK